MSDGRRCLNCERVLPFEAFKPNASTRGGPSSWCRECQAARWREWREANAEHVAAFNEERRAGPFALVCVGCGEPFEGSRRFMVRCPGCQVRHRRERGRV
jgi:hypothetical protein